MSFSPPANVPDVVVVGAGATGTVVAKELAEIGLGVVVLEAGPWHDPQREFTGLEWDMSNPFDGVLRWGPRDRTKPSWPRVRDGLGTLFQTAGVGGNTLRFGATCPRAHVDAIERDWPLSYRELAHYYYRVEETLPVSVPDVVAPKDELFIRGCEVIGIEHAVGPDLRASGWRMQSNAVLPSVKPVASMRYPAVDGCTQCGECLIGCRNPEGAPLERLAKRSANVTYAPAALRTGRCEFRTGAFATAIVFEEHEGKARARAVRYRASDGRRYEQQARVIVLAGGAVETPRLWLASGLPDRGVVGRYLTTHWCDYVSGVLPRNVDMFEGQTSMARADFPGYGSFESVGMGPLSFAHSTSFGPRAIRGDGPWAVSGRAWGSALKRRLEAYRHTLVIAITTDDDAVLENGVALSCEVSDEHNPAPVVRYRPTAGTSRRRDWLARRAAEVLLATGAEPDSIHRADAAPTTMHAHGTMRMHADPAAGVVDRDGEAHDVGRLFIADTSIFPNGAGGVAPGLTAQAVATRVAARIAARYFS
ncbi:MAG: GMC family oxidoreductase [Actinomycetota bacterium]